MLLDPLLEGLVDARLLARAWGTEILQHLGREADVDCLFGRRFWRPAMAFEHLLYGLGAKNLRQNLTGQASAVEVLLAPLWGGWTD